MFKHTQVLLLFLLLYTRCIPFKKADWVPLIRVAQSPIDSALRPGDQLPDLLLDSVLNYKTKSVRLQKLSEKGGLIISFWNLHCNTCVRSFPDLLALQKLYRGKIQFLIVADEPFNEIEKFLSKQKQLSGINMNLPLLCNSKKMKDLFPHRVDPYYAWVNNIARLKYLTDFTALTASNISSFLDSQSIQLSQGPEPEIAFNPLKPLFLKDYGGSGEKIRWFSVLSGYIPGMPWINGIAKDSVRSIALIYNSPVKAMFQSAYNDYPDNSLWIPDNRTIMETRDTTRLVYKVNGLYRPENYWSYQLITPKMEDSALKKIMQSELNRYFGVNAHMEKRKRVCWILSASDTNLIKARGGERKNYHNIQNFTLEIQNEKMGLLVERFVYFLLENSVYPFVDDTGYTGMVSICLKNVVYNNPATVIKALEEYKMTLRLEEREIDILVIRDN